MKQSELPGCPTCGLKPEYAFKVDRFGWHRGGLKCPYNHHRVQLESPAENKAKAMQVLAPLWCDSVEKLKPK
ncbi:hypothetical protein SI35_22855 [Salmonella enterica]|nr:hypothetical protein [Salmonella enterica]EGG4134814.1 hypothetical protein [Salmonella enterica]